MKYLALLALLLTSCTALPTDTAMLQPSPMATPALAQTDPPPTETPIPTATVDYQQTAIVAQSTSDEAARLMVQVTAEQDRRNFEQAGWTVTAEAIALQQQSMTQLASQFTATAYATSIPMTQTRQAAVDRAQATEIMLTITAPTQIAAMAKSETLAEYSDEMQAVELLIKIALATMLLALALLTFVITVVRLKPVMKPVAVEDKIDIPDLRAVDGVALEPIPLKDLQGAAWRKVGENEMIRAEIPCTVDQLMTLAEGITKRNLTLAFNQWEGTEVHKNLKEIRAFFVQQKFAKVLLGKGGELGIEPEGEAFLLDCLALGSPALPFVCVQNQAPPSSQV